MRRGLIVVALVAMLACHKEVSPPSSVSAPRAPASTADLDALWALAPDGATIGIVMSPRGLAMLDHAWHDIEAFMRAAPELANAVKEMQSTLQKELGVSSLSLAAAGLAADKGFATFGLTSNSTVMILPVADRAKFLAVVHGTSGADFDTIDKMRCKTVHGLYACADDPSRLDQIGKGRIRDQLARAGARGDVEIAGSIDNVAFAIVAQLARGAFVVRGTVTGVPQEIREAGFGRSKPRAPDDAAGFGVVDLRPMIRKQKLPPQPIVAGITAADMIDAIDGVLTIAIPASADQIDARLSLRNAKPIATLVGHCGDFPLAPPGLSVSGGTCHVALPQLKPLVMDASVEGNELRVVLKGLPGKGSPVARSVLGDEIARGEWALASWGRGTALATSFDWSSVLPTPAQDDTAYLAGAAFGVRFLAMLNEAGMGLQLDGDTVRFVLGVRTAWANPDEVVAQLVAIDPKDIVSGRAHDTGKKIADAAPNSPFASDFRTGTGGIAAATAPVGILAGVAIPAFMDYMKKSKKSEATLNLTKIGNHAKYYYAEHRAFPTGNGVLLPANDPHGLGNNCCGAKGGTKAAPGNEVINKCSADPDAFKRDPGWAALDIAIDEPTMYQYRYVGDAKHFTAYAVADLDCDGASATWTLRGSVDAAGNPVVELVPPPKGVF